MNNLHRALFLPIGLPGETTQVAGLKLSTTLLMVLRYFQWVNFHITATRFHPIAHGWHELANANHGN